MSPPGSSARRRADHLSSIFDTLHEYSHPFILVGVVANRWMGCEGTVDEGFDILVRNNQLQEIIPSLVATGHWTSFDANSLLEILDSHPYNPREVGERVFLTLCSEADAVLQSVDLEELGFTHMRLWSEETYKMRIDELNLVEVPDLFAMVSCLVEEEHHPALRREDGWWYGPRVLSTFDRPQENCSKLPRPASTEERHFISG